MNIEKARQDILNLMKKHNLEIVIGAVVNNEELGYLSGIDINNEPVYGSKVISERLNNEKTLHILLKELNQNEQSN